MIEDTVRTAKDISLNCENCLDPVDNVSRVTTRRKIYRETPFMQCSTKYMQRVNHLNRYHHVRLSAWQARAR